MTRTLPEEEPERCHRCCTTVGGEAAVCGDEHDAGAGGHAAEGDGLHDVGVRDVLAGVSGRVELGP